MIFVGAFINYSTRINISISIVAMVKSAKKELIPECIVDASVRANDSKLLADYGPRYHWSEEVQGNIIGSFYWGYTVGCLPSGIVAEWLGPTAVIFWFTLITAILNALCVPAAALHYSALIALRAFIGLLGTFIYPSFQVLIAKWSPPLEKGKFTSALLGNGLSSVINWPVLTSVTVHFGWDWGFYVVSMQLVVFCMIFWLVCADSPVKHPFISEAEVEYIKSCQAGKVGTKRCTAPYLRIISNTPFWVLVMGHTGSMWGLYVQMSTLPKYMSQVIGFDLKKTGAVAMLPQLSRVFVALTMGIIADSLAKKGILSPIEIRKHFCFFSHFIPGILTIGISFFKCNVAAIVLVLIGLGLNGAAVVTTLLNSQDLSPNFAGTVFGFISFFGGVSGCMVPMVTGVCIRQHSGINEWGLAFYIGGTIYLFGGVIFMLFGTVDEQDWNKIPE